MWPARTRRPSATASSATTSSRSRQSRSCCWLPWSAPSSWRERTEVDALHLSQFLFLAAILFCIGVYGVLARRNGVMVLMSIELILNSVNINLVAFGAYHGTVAGQVFALFIIAVAAAEVGVGLAIVLMIYRNRSTIDLESASLMKG